MNELEAAYADFVARTEQIPFAAGAEFLFGAFRALSKSDFLIPGKHFLSAFEMAAIAKFIYLNAPSNTRNAVDWAPVINAYKTLWREAENRSDYPDTPDVIASFVLRFVYQQLLWNITPSKMDGNFKRTLGIFGGNSAAGRELRLKFESASGLPLEDFLKVAHAMYGIFMGRQSVADHEFSAALQQHFTPSQVSATGKILVATRGKFRKYYETHASPTPGGTPYEMNPLLRFPIMLRDERYWCVYAELINYAATRGLYFYIADAVGGPFNQAFGDAFEDYVCKLLTNSLGPERIITEKDERKAGWKGKTNDLTIILSDAAILFECKNSGLFSVSKRSAAPLDLAADIKMNIANPSKGKGLFQLHAKVEAIRDGKIPEELRARYANVKRFFPVVLLHDELWFANRPEILKNLIDDELKKNRIERFEYQIWHVEELENLLKFVPEAETLKVVEGKFSSPECMALDLSIYLSTRYPLRGMDVRLFTPTGDSKALQIIRKLAEGDAQCPD